MILLTVSSLKQKKEFWGETPNLETRISNQWSGKPWAFWPCKRGKTPANLSRRVPLLGNFFVIPCILCPFWVYCFFLNVNLANTKLKPLLSKIPKCHLLPNFCQFLLATQTFVSATCPRGRQLHLFPDDIGATNNFCFFWYMENCISKYCWWKDSCTTQDV